MATKKKPVEAGPTAPFEVLSSLSHDGEDYAVGESVDLTEAQALELGTQVVKPITAAK